MPAVGLQMLPAGAQTLGDVEAGNAAARTPADVASQLLMAGPLITLFGISIGIAYLAQPKTTADTSEPEEPSG